ncbi:carbonic anhydrase 2-like [Phlebotomus argentipes]|uniref:carbonic anhydrase 2-like n=1 Tax=Phlebotomus argentipes TaxID=94469 RepID=UPI002892C1B4|nr:carbonic anhydrase 2-like [Phlebotomus argentipes]
MRFLVIVVLVAVLATVCEAQFSGYRRPRRLRRPATIKRLSEVSTLIAQTAEKQPDYNPTEDFYGYEEDSEFPPSRWGEKWPVCAGLQESPINIQLNTCKKDTALYPMKLHNFDAIPLTSTIQNLGHAVQVVFTYGKITPSITRGFYRLTKYNFQQLHFHFGKTDEDGSEHTIDTKNFVMEAHMVFSKSTYASITEASQDPEGLIVLAFLFEVAEDDEVNKSPIGFLADVLAQIGEPGQSVTVADAKAHRLIDIIGSTKFEYVRYAGSLTTPPCSEAVTWLVSTKALKVNRKTLDGFREVNSFEGKMAGNHRPVQPINGRECFIH